VKPITNANALDQRGEEGGEHNDSLNKPGIDSVKELSM